MATPAIIITSIVYLILGLIYYLIIAAWEDRSPFAFDRKPFFFFGAKAMMSLVDNEGDFGRGFVILTWVAWLALDIISLTCYGITKLTAFLFTAALGGYEIQE